MAYLIDKSALARMEDPRVRARLAPVIAAGEAATCAIVELEILYSARNQDDHARTLARRQLAYRHIELTDAIFGRAIKVQGLLAARGQHRLPIPDLIIAAAAEVAGIAVLHYDADFDTIAAVTQQEMEWVAPRGSL